MGTKNISIMDDVYIKLRARKGAQESFSDVIRRSLEEKKDPLEFAGAWSHMSEEEIDELKKNIQKMRHETTEEINRRLKRITDDLS